MRTRQPQGPCYFALGVREDFAVFEAEFYDVRISFNKLFKLEHHARTVERSHLAHDEGLLRVGDAARVSSADERATSKRFRLLQG